MLQVGAALRSMVRATFGTAFVDAAVILGYPVFLGWLHNAFIKIYRTTFIWIGVLVVLPYAAAGSCWEAPVPLPFTHGPAAPVELAVLLL